MSNKIHRLDDATIDRIAAGEVVERPASVAKELVENSLDADATRIDVEVDGGGDERLLVRDNGRGIPSDEIELAVEKHTTSKIEDVKDLDGGVNSLGFRGEALATIGAVSRLTLTSRHQDESVGTRLEMQGGEIESIESSGRPQGTTVTVENLFFNVPARAKFLKTNSTEFGHINQIVTRYALANPDVAISLVHDDQEVFSTPGDGDLRSTLLAVYGREV
ncbi:MAG: DNA mismatch repair endonuclease MutL, partial [Halobacteriaceae archaeon]